MTNDPSRGKDMIARAETVDTGPNAATLDFAARLKANRGQVDGELLRHMVRTYGATETSMLLNAYRFLVTEKQRQAFEAATAAVIQ
ncbi:MAG TPA: hypothetical protein VFG51_02370 [Candidatus Saccharimonadia bacterium]|nr:hypothetical protein [Candidatus Saccharimonadia bacterium]